MIERRFGESPPVSIGLEEEVMILDAETLELSPGVQLLVDGSEQRELPGRLKTELHASVVELNTAVCDSVADGVAALRVMRAAADEIARGHGLRIAAAGTHPFSRSEEQPIVPQQRYKAFLAYGGVSVRRQAVNGLHVHVGMPGAGECYRALEGILPWLPLVLALSANSPYVAGEATGLASNRAEVLAQLPRAGAPPAFGSYGGWEAFVERFVAAGVAEDYTRFWWDVRPHPWFGTLEIRIADQPTELAQTEALAALLQTLAAHAMRAPAPPDAPARRGDYAQNRWAALRFGTDAALIHPRGDLLVSAPDLVSELVEELRPTARALGTENLLERLDGGSSEGVRQLQVGQAEGLRTVAEDLVRRTVRSS